MPRISVVVPIYNVEAYLRDCLESLAAQSLADLEVVMVDDGSTDSSRAIAEAMAQSDERFRLVCQANAGLGAARNAGAEQARGEFLAFVDSDDLLPRHAYRTLLRSLERTGSDFATGNVHRFNRAGASQAPFLARAFATSRPATHITRHRALVDDRIAPNKLWRRSFWDRHGLRFPEGVTHEDIPVVLPAHFLARSVDVIAEPVYLYRLRETGGLSITQRRLEPRVLRDRVTAVTHVSRFLGSSLRRRRHKRWYDTSALAEDLRYFVNVLPHADGAYRELFLDLVNGFLDTVDRRSLEPLAAIERLKWELVRRRLIDELLEVIRFQREDLREAAPVEQGGRFYGDYPFRTDERLALPRSVYELRQELRLAAQVESIRWEGGRAHVRGFAFITGVGAPRQGSQQVRLVALRKGRLRWLRRVRRRLPWLGIRIRTREVHRPELTAAVRQQLAELSWAGFEALLPARALDRWPARSDDEWELYAQARSGHVTRRTVRFAVAPAHPARGADLVHGASLLRVGPAPGQRLAMSRRRRWAIVREHGGAGGTIELRGELHGFADAPRLELRHEHGATREYELSAEGSGFTVRVPVADVLVEQPPAAGAAGEDDAEEGARWEAWLVAGRRRTPLALAADVPPGSWAAGAIEVALHRSFAGDAVLVARRPQPVVCEARWLADGRLRVDGVVGSWSGPLEVALVSRASGAQHPFATAQAPDGSFGAELTPLAHATMGGELPLREGSWHVCARPPGVRDEQRLVPVSLAGELVARLPLEARAAGRRLALGALGGDRAVLLVGRDLDDDERGGYHQRRLSRRVYPAARREPLRDAVVYASFAGRQYSDSPRAIHEELVRRGAPLEHLWVVRDGMTRLPAGATLVREGSRAHFEALATARWVVANDALPSWFERREDQVCLQTLAGAPLKRVGRDAAAMPPTQRRYDGAWRAGAARQWSHVLSPGPAVTGLLRDALEIEGELLETGTPRTDRLVGPAAERERAELRRALGLADGVRVVLYAPTFRDHAVDHRGRPRIDLHLDVERLRAALGSAAAETVVLFRKHHVVIDQAPATPDGFVRDASAYPDATDLLLAADVLVSDYSSAIFDFALTGRPIVLFCYDLELYREEVRGLYLDPERVAPGAVVRDSEELGETLAALDEAGGAPAARHAELLALGGEVADGGATRRAVDALLATR